MKLLSVVIPVFNELHTIAHILAAVSQALPEVEKEVIVVDDGSLDGTSEWIRLNIPKAIARPRDSTSTRQDIFS